MTAMVTVDDDEAVAKPMTSSSASSAVNADLLPSSAFVCAKCRCFLFSNVHLISHRSGDGNARSFAHKTSSSAASTKPTCSSYFTEPLSSLCDTTLSEGNILCPKCSARIGTFSWAGEQCSCAQWVTPAFKVTKSKVDEKIITSTLTDTKTAATSSIIRFHPFAQQAVIESST